MEKLLAREVTIFPEKNKSFNILLKIHKTQHEIVRKAYQGSKRCQNPKLKIFGLSPLPMQTPYSKHFWTLKFNL